MKNNTQLIYEEIKKFWSQYSTQNYYDGTLLIEPGDNPIIFHSNVLYALIVREAKSLGITLLDSGKNNNKMILNYDILLYTKNELNFVLNDLGFRKIQIYRYNILHNFRNFTFFKKIKSWIRTILCIIPM